MLRTLRAAGLAIAISLPLTPALANFEGRGTERNFPAAYEWLKNAAEQGVSAAQYSLGLMHEQWAGRRKSHSDGLYAI